MESGTFKASADILELFLELVSGHIVTFIQMQFVSSRMIINYTLKYTSVCKPMNKLLKSSCIQLKDGNVDA